MNEIDRNMWVPGMVADITPTVDGYEREPFRGCFWDSHNWVTPMGSRIHESERGVITGVRPWVKIDPEDDDAIERLVDHYLRASTSQNGPRGRMRATLRAYVEETWPQKPSRIDEPGQWGIVEAGTSALEVRRKWVRDGDKWNELRGWETAFWDMLVDPVLVRDGVGS